MKTFLYALTIAFSAIANADEEGANRFYDKLSYSLSEVTEENRHLALEPLAAIREFQRVRGLAGTCGTIYHLTDTGRKSVGYGSICRTAQDYLKGFFCWDSEGRYFGYATKLQSDNAHWMGDSILHGCGGATVPEPDYRHLIPSYELVATIDGWALPEVGWGETRPVDTMLYSDLARLGFDINPRCDDIRLIYRDAQSNDHYGATCKIDEADNRAVLCFDNTGQHFALFTRYRPKTNWTELTIYRFCWNS